MTVDRIKEIQLTTGYPDSVSVQQALLQIWNEVAQESNQVQAVESFPLDEPVIVKLADIYSAMAYLFNGGEFPDWLNKQGIPLGAMKEYEEAKNYFDENIKSKFSE